MKTVLKFFAGCFSLACLSACHHREAAGQVPEPTAAGEEVVVQTNSPQVRALRLEPVSSETPAAMPLTGRLIWDENATVRIFTPFSGIVRKVCVEVNQRVTKGMALVQLQSADFGQAHADARRAESEFRRAQRNLDRLRDLFEHGAAPRKDLESAEADFTSAEVEKERAESRLAIYGASPGSTNRDFLLPSPLDGVVVEKSVTPGQEVRPDQMLANMPQFTAPLFVVTDPSRLWVQMDASEVDLPHLRPGCEFTFTSRAFPGQTFTGRVETVSEFIDPVTRTTKVRGTVENSQRLLKAEMFVSVNVPDAAGAGASVPSKAVFLNGDKHYVFVQEQPGKFARRQVEVGSEQDGRVLVLAGLQPGQKVVSEGCILLQQVLPK